MAATIRPPLAEDTLTRVRASELRFQLDLLLTLASLEFTDLLGLIFDALGHHDDLPPRIMDQERTLSPLRMEMLERALRGENELIEAIDPRATALARCYIAYIRHRLLGHQWEWLLRQISNVAHDMAARTGGDCSPAGILQDDIQRRSLTNKTSFGYAQLRKFVASAVEVLTTSEAPLVAVSEPFGEEARYNIANLVVQNFTHINVPSN